MRVVLYGASGMIGSGALLECLEHPDVLEVLVVGRRSSGVTHEKVTEIVGSDVTDLTSVADRLGDFDCCIYSVGIASAGMSEEAYTEITCDLTVAVARQLLPANPGMNFCFVSGQGTDSTEKGRVMWARVKGRTENELSKLGFGGAWMFRPGFIQPMKGVRSRTALYRTLYAITTPLYPLLRKVAAKSLMTSVELGLALIRAGRVGAPKRVLEVADIKALAEEERAYLATR